MKNSPVEIIAIGQDETSDEVFFSMTVKTDDLKTWLQSACGEQSTLGRHLNEALLVETMRLFDVGQNADIGDTVNVYTPNLEFPIAGTITSMTDNTVGVDGVIYSLDDCSLRYSSGKMVELFDEMAEDALLDLTS